MVEVVALQLMRLLGGSLVSGGTGDGGIWQLGGLEVTSASCPDMLKEPVHVCHAPNGTLWQWRAAANVPHVLPYPVVPQYESENGAILCGFTSARAAVLWLLHSQALLLAVPWDPRVADCPAWESRTYNLRRTSGASTAGAAAGTKTVRAPQPTRHGFWLPACAPRGTCCLTH